MTGVNLLLQKPFQIVVGRLLGLFLGCTKICIIYTILKYISNVNYLKQILHQFETTGVRYVDFINPAIERVHLQFCKRILNVEKSSAI